MGLKREIKSKVLGKLTELKVLEVSYTSAQQVEEASSDDVPSTGPCASPHVGGQRKEANLATPQGGVLVHEAPPAMLPRFELSLHSQVVQVWILKLRYA